MAKNPVSEQRYLGLLNEALKKQDGYLEGMAFVAAPSGSSGSGMSGYDTATPYERSHAYAAAVKVVSEAYELVPGYTG